MIAIHWFRRDLRLEDNTALSQALSGDLPTLPIFIFDRKILDELPSDDGRITFIYDQLQLIHEQLQQVGSDILILHGDPLEVWSKLIDSYPIGKVYVNRDYEPYARTRDREVEELLIEQQIPLESFKDQVVFETDEILKQNGTPYTVFTPYKNRWLEKYKIQSTHLAPALRWNNFHQLPLRLPSLQDLGFETSTIKVKSYDLTQLSEYAAQRNYPSADASSYLSPHLRFGTVSIRKVFEQAFPLSDVFASELIWREFFMQILYHFPRVVNENFKTKYNSIVWRNNSVEFNLWCQGKTGYALVDAGMRELNQTGYMHNRVRMVAAGFLCKHLLIDWRWGEAYFAQKLLDYELSSNNGNWQWAAGTGCDAAPYFRVFNPVTQLKKFDPESLYVKKWLPEYGTKEYPEPMIDHALARNRAINHYKEALESG